MIILSVDSSSEAASVSILDDGKLLGEMNFNYKKQHSVLLMDMIDSLLKACDLNISDIEGYVISKGPGSFTGLRIGMATIKGLALGSKKPFISVSSIDALAYNLYGCSAIVCPIMDALRGNVYTNLYKYEDGNLIALDEYMLLSLEELKDKLSAFDETPYFIGDGTEKHKEAILELIPNAKFAPSHLNFTRSSSLGELGLRLLKEGIKEDINNSAPFYIRKSQAEREYEKKMGCSVDE